MQIKKRNLKVLIAIILIFVTAVIAYKMSSSSEKVLLQTNYGDITIELYADMPITTGN